MSRRSRARGSLESGAGELNAIFDGRGKQHDPETAPLSEIIGMINERYGLNLGPADQIFFDQLKSHMVQDPDLGEQARANDIDHFRLVFEKRFLNDIVTRMDGNEAIFKRILDDQEFRGDLFEVYLCEVYRTLREGAA